MKRRKTVSPKVSKLFSFAIRGNAFPNVGNALSGYASAALKTPRMTMKCAGTLVIAATLMASTLIPVSSLAQGLEKTGHRQDMPGRGKPKPVARMGDLK